VESRPPLPIALSMMAMALVTLVSVYLAAETWQEDVLEG
jgi:hypothetical protein